METLSDRQAMQTIKNDEGNEVEHSEQMKVQLRKTISRMRHNEINHSMNTK